MRLAFSVELVFRVSFLSIFLVMINFPKSAEHHQFQKWKNMKANDKTFRKNKILFHFEAERERDNVGRRSNLNEILICRNFNAYGKFKMNENRKLDIGSAIVHKEFDQLQTSNQSVCVGYGRWRNSKQKCWKHIYWWRKIPRRRCAYSNMK